MCDTCEADYKLLSAVLQPTMKSLTSVQVTTSPGNIWSTSRIPSSISESENIEKPEQSRFLKLSNNSTLVFATKNSCLQQEPEHHKDHGHENKEKQEE